MDLRKRYVDTVVFLKNSIRAVTNRWHILFFLGIIAVNGYAVIGVAMQEPLDSESVEDIVYEEINDRRAEHGLEPLNRDMELAQIAEFHSEDMAERNYYDHRSPEGEDFEDRYQQAGYRCEIQVTDSMTMGGAETIHKTHAREDVQTTRGVRQYDNESQLAHGIVNAWMNSTAHEAIILHHHYRNHGVGVEITEDDTVYVTQNFC